MHCIHLGVLQLHNGSVFTLLDELGFLAIHAYVCVLVLLLHIVIYAIYPSTLKNHARLVRRCKRLEWQDDLPLRPLQSMGLCAADSEPRLEQQHIFF